MKTIRFIAILLFINNPLLCLAQDYSLKDFIPTLIPKGGSKEWYELNRASDKEFVFTLKEGKIHIERYKYAPTKILEITNGKLIGVNKGEWGGGLYFKPKDSTKQFFVNGRNIKEIEPEYFGGLIVSKKNSLANIIKDAKLIQSGNTQFIFKFNDSICFMSGVALTFKRYGNLHTLKCTDNSFVVSKPIILGDTPAAIYIYKDILYLAGSKGFYIIDKNWNIQTILDDLFWDGLYPTSVVVLNKQNVYVTIRGGYVKINPENKKIVLYKAK